MSYIINHPEVIKNPSVARNEKKAHLDGLIDMSVSSRQKQYIDGLINSPSRNDSLEPIKAEGSAVGAPTIPKGKKVKIAPMKTKEVPGLVEPEPSKKF
jgi:hypothetical protein